MEATKNIAQETELEMKDSAVAVNNLAELASRLNELIDSLQTNGTTEHSPSIEKDKAKAASFLM